MGLGGDSGTRLPLAAQQLEVTPRTVAAQVATPAADDVRRADGIVAAIPEALRDLAAGRESVMPLLLGLLLADDDALAAHQQAEIGARLWRIPRRPRAAHPPAAGRRPAPDAAAAVGGAGVPGAAAAPAPGAGCVLATVAAVVAADGEVSLLECSLGRLLAVQVRESLDPSRYARFGRRKPGNIRQEFATLLAVVAQAGHADAASARRAYLAGMQRVLPRDHLPYAPPANGVQALDAVWEPLDALDPLAKQVMVEAVTDAVSHDGRVSVAEAELLRTICGVLHCPLPPMLESS